MTIRRTVLARVGVALLSVLAVPTAARAGWDLSVFGGVAFPTYEQRFTVRAPTVVPLPGFVVQPADDLTIDAKGGSVFGAALCGEVGVLGIEGRFDSTAIELRTSGLTYGLRYSAPPLPTFTGSLSIAPGPLETSRLNLLSLNLRLRTPGPVSLVASGGFSYLPDFDVTGSTPVQLAISGIPALDQTGTFRLRVAPTESSHRFGVNAGAGLRFTIAPGVSLFGEGRVFYFKEYELSIDVDDPRLQALVGAIEEPRFRPVVVNAVGGLVFSF
jgi:hypothetical protein